jgi:S-disulfanyl-L-cysteine oxidoreductase SoxD
LCPKPAIALSAAVEKFVYSLAMTHRWKRHAQPTSRLFAAIVLAAAATIAGSELAAAPQAAPQAKTVWNGVYTEQQAARGSITFSTSCARCHSAEPNGGEEGRRLAGDPFWQSFRESTVDHLLDYVSKNMPNGAGGTLSANNYADVVAFILSLNGLPAGSAELTRDSAAGVQIIAKDGPGELPNGTLVRVIGCVARKEGGGWILDRATAPVRTQPSDAVGADEATRPLGDRSYALMFLLTPLDRNVGHRMRVRGLLIGEGGKNGINVSTTQSLSESCP